MTTPRPRNPNIPTRLKIEHVGDVAEEKTIRTWTGRRVTISGHGPVGRRVEVIDLAHGLAGGDAIAPDGTWRLVTVVLPLGTTRKIVARSIRQDGTEESPNSKPVTVVIPA